MRLRLFDIGNQYIVGELKKGDNQCPINVGLNPHLLQCDWASEGFTSRLVCKGCGTEFLTHVLSTRDVLREMIVKSVSRLPGRELEVFETDFKASLSDEEKEELENVLHTVKEEVGHLIDSDKLSVVFYRTKHGFSDSKLLFSPETVFGITSPKLTLQMSGN